MQGLWRWSVSACCARICLPLGDVVSGAKWQAVWCLLALILHRGEHSTSALMSLVLAARRRREGGNFYYGPCGSQAARFSRFVLPPHSPLGPYLGPLTL